MDWTTTLGALTVAFTAGRLARMVSRLIAGLALLSTVLGACSSTTVIRSNPPGAKVYLDDVPVGMTPYAMSDTKIVGSSTRVRLEYPGYRPYYGVITRNERFDTLACVGGVFLLVPFLWIMKYHDDHYYELGGGMPMPAAAVRPPQPQQVPAQPVTATPNPTPASPDPVPAQPPDYARADQLNEEGKALFKNNDFKTAAMR